MMWPFLALQAAGTATRAATGTVNSYFDRKNKLKLQQRQQDFQQMMASTHYQRAFNSMQAAGINPVMAAGGSGTSAPVSATGGSNGMQDGMMSKEAEALLETYAKTGHFPKVSHINPN